MRVRGMIGFDYSHHGHHYPARTPTGRGQSPGGGASRGGAPTGGGARRGGASSSGAEAQNTVGGADGKTASFGCRGDAGSEGLGCGRERQVEGGSPP